MPGWLAIAATHTFAVADRRRAEVLAEALSWHGFAMVTGEPRGSGSWQVTAFDEGPYPQDVVGHRTIDTVGRRAAALARDHGGYYTGSGRELRVNPDTPVPSPQDAPIVVTDPGARPPAVEIVMTAAPPDVPLGWTPDTVLPGTADLTGLREIAWKRLDHVNYDTDRIPDIIEALATDRADWHTLLNDLLSGDVLHQGSCYPATAPTLAFLIRIAASGTLPARHRHTIAAWLIFAAHQRASVFLSNPDRDAFLGRPPPVPVHVQQVHDTIGEHLPTLLTRWDREPPAVRYLLAALAGLYPEPGRQLTAQVDAMARQHTGTQPGAYLDLAVALLHTDHDKAIRSCRTIYGWNEQIPLDWLDAPGVPPAIRAGRILADGVLSTTSTR
jgi:hypothetical protein